MIMIRLLACLSRSDSSEFGSQNNLSPAASHGASIISSLRVYRATYGIRHDYWFGQACFRGAVAVLYDYENNPGLFNSIAFACELLLAVGEYLPTANRYLWTIKALAARRHIALPRPCAKVFSILAARDGRKVLANVRVVDLGPSRHGIDVVKIPSHLPCNVTFSGVIEGYQSLEQAPLPRPASWL